MHSATKYETRIVKYDETYRIAAPRPVRVHSSVAATVGSHPVINDKNKQTTQFRDTGSWCSGQRCYTDACSGFAVSAADAKASSRSCDGRFRSSIAGACDGRVARVDIMHDRCPTAMPLLAPPPSHSDGLCVNISLFLRRWCDEMTFVFGQRLCVLVSSRPVLLTLLAIQTHLA